ncbi:MAG: BrnT family toxin [Pyrinomonadaceae bacterium]
MRFEWNLEKAKANLKNHKVSFEEAETVFEDPLFIIYADPDHSVEENRFIVMGESTKNRLLVVSYTERPPVTRLISARKATRAERKNYEEEI